MFLFPRLIHVLSSWHSSSLSFRLAFEFFTLLCSGFLSLPFLLPPHHSRHLQCIRRINRGLCFESLSFHSNDDNTLKFYTRSQALMHLRSPTWVGNGAKIDTKRLYWKKKWNERAIETQPLLVVGRGFCCSCFAIETKWIILFSLSFGFAFESSVLWGCECKRQKRSRWIRHERAEFS